MTKDTKSGEPCGCHHCMDPERWPRRLPASEQEDLKAAQIRAQEADAGRYTMLESVMGEAKAAEMEAARIMGVANRWITMDPKDYPATRTMPLEEALSLIVYLEVAREFLSAEMARLTKLYVYPRLTEAYLEEQKAKVAQTAAAAAPGDFFGQIAAAAKAAGIPVTFVEVKGPPPAGGVH